MFHQPDQPEKNGPPSWSHEGVSRSAGGGGVHIAGEAGGTTQSARFIKRSSIRALIAIVICTLR